MTKARRLVIFGSAEIAELAHFYFQADSDYEVVAFTVDDAFVDRQAVKGLPLIPFTQVTAAFPPDQYDMFVAVSYQRLNQLRAEKYRQAKAAGYRLASYVCSRSVTWCDLTIGDNCFLLENQTIQPTVVIGNNVMIWSGNHIGHGSTIGDHAYIASHVVISGHCRIGERCFIGVNATIRDFTSIGESSFIGMAASVVTDVPPNAVVIGEAATIIPGDDRRAKALKKRYFGQTPEERT